jgi:hypothetical protein
VVTTTKSHEPEEHASADFISADSEDWIRQFIKHLDLHLIDSSRNLAPKASVAELQEAAARAVVETYRDSGMELESIMELVGRVAVEARFDKPVWCDALNKRRFALIDKEIQGLLTQAERVELAGLTSMMRAHIDSEANLPMQGARSLHRRLLQLKSL